MLDDHLLATISLISVSLSLPLYLYGVWIILRVEQVTWRILMAHLRVVITALALTTIPVLFWMLPQSFTWGFSGLIAVHIFLALQSYALLLIGLWGIVPIFRAKHRHNLYHDPDPDIDLTELDERMPHWRRRLRIGVFGHLVFWILSYFLGIAFYLRVYL